MPISMFHWRSLRKRTVQGHNAGFVAQWGYGEGGGWGGEWVIERWIIQPDQIKMWQGAKMAAWVLQSQSSDLAGPIIQRSPSAPTVRWHWCCSCRHRQNANGKESNRQKRGTGAYWCFWTENSEVLHRQNAELVPIFIGLENIYPLPSVQGNEGERERESTEGHWGEDKIPGDRGGW